MLILHRSKYLTFLLLGAIGALAQTRVPQEGSRITSPDRQLTIVNVDRDEAPHHCIYLQNHSANEPLYCYERHAQIFWSPDGKRIAITDYFASDQSRVMLLNPLSDVKPTDLTRLILDQLSVSHTGAGLSAMSHLYCEVVRWKSDSTLEIKFQGYGDGSNRHVAQVFDYTINGKIVRLR